MLLLPSAQRVFLEWGKSGGKKGGGGGGATHMWLLLNECMRVLLLVLVFIYCPDEANSQVISLPAIISNEPEIMFFIAAAGSV